MADEIPLIPVVPPKLREAALRGALIPFVAAGASNLAGCPTWAQFADRALQAVVVGGKFSYGQLVKIRHLNPRVKLSIAQGLTATLDVIEQARSFSFSVTAGARKFWRAARSLLE